MLSNCATGYVPGHLDEAILNVTDVVHARLGRQKEGHRDVRVRVAFQENYQLMGEFRV